jgi:hypothetical protein
MTFAGCMRKSRIVRWVHRAIAGFVLPGLGLALIFATIAVTVSRTTVSYRTGQGAFCRSQATPDDKLIAASAGTSLVREGFQIGKLCWASGVSLEKGRHYTIWIEMVEPFFDQTIMTDIAGFRDLSLRHLTTMPILRWWSADWFQPIARIGVSGTAEWPLVAVDGAEALDVGVDVHGDPRPIRFYEAPEYASRLMELHEGDGKADPSRLSACDKIPEAELPVAQAIRKRQRLRTTYVSQFIASDDGELFLFVNDAIAAIPFAPTIECFYTNNTGKAKVTIERTPAPKPAISQTSK